MSGPAPGEQTGHLVSGMDNSEGNPARKRSLEGSRRFSVPWRIFGAFRSFVFTVGSILGVVSILAVAGAFLFGLRPVVVISGSMEPGIPVGSVIFVQSVPVSEVAVGDVVTVERPRNLGLVTHRVVEIVDAEGVVALELQGDANASPDPEPYAVQNAGLLKAQVPFLGYVTLFFQSTQGILAGVGFVVALIALYLLDPARFLTSSGEEAPHPDGS